MSVTSVSSLAEESSGVYSSGFNTGIASLQSQLKDLQTQLTKEQQQSGDTVATKQQKELDLQQQINYIQLEIQLQQQHTVRPVNAVSAYTSRQAAADSSAQSNSADEPTSTPSRQSGSIGHITSFSGAIDELDL